MWISNGLEDEESHRFISFSSNSFQFTTLPLAPPLASRCHSLHMFLPDLISQFLDLTLHPPSRCYTAETKPDLPLVVEWVSSCSPQNPMDWEGITVISGFRTIWSSDGDARSARTNALDRWAKNVLKWCANDLIRL